MEMVYCQDPQIDPVTAEDIVRAVERQPRDEDFFLIVSSGDDDFMEATLEDDGSFAVECEEKGYYANSLSMVDETLLKSLFLSFLNGDGQWRSLCKWEAPAPGAKPAAKPWHQSPNVLWLPSMVLPLVLILLFLGQGTWIVVLFALAIPGFIAFATTKKVAEVKRASLWTKANARIVKSGLATVTRHGKEVRLPEVEYEFSVGFHPFRGRRISIGEIMPGTPEVGAALARYPVGASATVYYNPENPKESVIERELPAKFGMIWIFIAVLAVACVGAAIWMIGPANLFNR